jgi:hypothetical protein
MDRSHLGEPRDFLLRMAGGIGNGGANGHVDQYQYYNAQDTAIGSKKNDIRQNKRGLPERPPEILYGVVLLFRRGGGAGGPFLALLAALV